MKPFLERINLDHTRSIHAFHHDEKHFETPWHIHPQLELTYISESVGTKFIGDYVGSYQTGELVLLAGNLPHYWKNIASVTQNAKSTVIQWNQGIFSNSPELKSVYVLLKKAKRGLLFDHKHTKKIVLKVLQLPAFSGSHLYLRLLEVLVILAETPSIPLSKKSFNTVIPDLHEQRISLVYEYVEGHYHQKIRLEDLGQLLNMSEQSFSRFFSQLMGKPFFTFLNEYRINIAVRMLLDTDRSVAEVGYACGYESLPFFHKQFNKLKEATPGKFRKRYRKL